VTPVKPKKVMGPGLVFLTSGLGGMVGWAVIHPANTLAVRMSLNPPGTKFSLSAMLAKSGGIYGLYDGLSAGILRQAFYLKRSVIFYTNIAARQILRPALVSVPYVTIQPVW
jgi:hypothetical protein